MATLKELVNEATNIKNELVECHTSLKNNLIKKGIECSDNDKIPTLIDKVKDINTNGKKWATGTDSYQLINSNYYLVVNGLDFRPTDIIAFSTDGNSIAVYSSTVMEGKLFGSRDTNIIGYDHQKTISNTGFKIQVRDNATYNWIAFG